MHPNESEKPLDADGMDSETRVSVGDFFGDARPTNAAQATPATVKPQSGRLVLGCLGLAILGLMGGTAAFLFWGPGIGWIRQTREQRQCASNLREIGYAIQAYHAEYDCFPPAYTETPDGTRLHSWRTLILPYLPDADEIYGRIAWEEPWDSEANQALWDECPAVYQCPTNEGNSKTTYVAVVDRTGVFRGSATTRFETVTDPMRETLLIVETGTKHAVPWMSPNDIDTKIFVDKDLEGVHGDKCQGCAVDGSVLVLHKTLDFVSKSELVHVADEVEANSTVTAPASGSQGESQKLGTAPDDTEAADDTR